jgi:hypothetical protein
LNLSRPVTELLKNAIAALNILLMLVLGKLNLALLEGW